MTRIQQFGLAALLAAAGACTDLPLTEPGRKPADPAGAGLSSQAASPAHARQERLARRLAIALGRDAQLRAALVSALRASPHPEGKIHFQWLLDRGGIGLATAMARAGDGTAGDLSRDAADAGPLELYLPVDEHRARWTGGPELLVATAIADRDIPVAFDGTGRRVALDGTRPPSTPVLALVPAEQRSTGAFPSTELECSPEMDECAGSGGGTGGTGGGASLVSPGLYMTYASFVGTFESWVKGDPEFETHVLGQEGTGTTLTSYQCAGEHAGGPYTYDQNEKTWSGTVLLFSQAQLDTYKTQHPGHAVRVFVIEDDDTACVIKTEGDKASELFRVVDQAYKTWTGGRDTVFSVSKYFAKAKALQQVWNAIASVINTADEIVGTAIQDAVAAQSWPGANWIVKGENNVTNGGIRLEMR
jgi:hypothetical protein